MLVVGNLLGAVAELLHSVLLIYTLVIVAHALLSWFRLSPHHPAVRVLARLSDLVLDPIRRLVPVQALGVDFSPLLAILLLQFADRFLVGSLGELAGKL